MDKLKEPLVHLFKRSPGQCMADCVLYVQLVVQLLIPESVTAEGSGNEKPTP